MTENEELNKTLKNICNQALRGELTLNDFIKTWPADRANANPFLTQMYKDLEDGVEHVPGFLFKKGINYKAWYKSAMYFTIYLDAVLLDYEKDPNELLKCRKTVLDQTNLSEEIIKNKVKEYFS